MHIEKSNENKLVIILIMIILIGILIFLVINLNKKEDNTDTVTKNITCTLETNDEGEETSEITIKSDGTKATSLSFNYLYVYSDNAYTLQLINDNQKTNVDNLNKIEGITASLSYDEAASILEVKGTVDYSNLKNVTNLNEPYNNYIKSSITEGELTKYFASQGYTCE